jgi:hypothetical protein
VRCVACLAHGDLIQVGGRALSVVLYICNWSIGLEFHIVTVARVLQTYNVNWTIQIYSNSIFCQASCHYVSCEMSGDDSLTLHNQPGGHAGCLPLFPAFFKSDVEELLFPLQEIKRGCIIFRFSHSGSTNFCSDDRKDDTSINGSNSASVSFDWEYGRISLQRQ